MAGIAKLLSSVFQAPSITTASPVVRQSEGSYSGNPFVNYNGFSSKFYAQNKPVRGGYFAGYYNGKQNIVGRRLFVEV